jgi:hypothetical protein
MTSSTPHTTRWGILATGWISNKFALDLLVDPKTRDVSDVQHKIAAVGSRSKESAEKFVKNTWEEAGVTEGKEDVKLYASYEELVNDPVRLACSLSSSPSPLSLVLTLFYTSRTSTSSTLALLTLTTINTSTSLFPPASQFSARRRSLSTLRKLRYSSTLLARRTFSSWKPFVIPPLLVFETTLTDPVFHLRRCGLASSLTLTRYRI